MVGITPEQTAKLRASFNELTEVYQKQRKTLAQLLRACLAAIAEVNPHDAVAHAAKQRELKKQLRTTLPQVIAMLEKEQTNVPQDSNP